MSRDIVVRPPADLSRAVHAIYREVRRGHRVTAVWNKPERLRAALEEIGLSGVTVVRHAVCAQPLLEPFTPRPLRVALLGHGTVGTGLYRRLAELPDRYQVTAIAVRDVRKAEAAGAPSRLLHAGCQPALNRECDAVVELIGGTHPASEIIEQSLRTGRHVVTANKAVIAARGPWLESLAHAAGVELLYSASVGGAMPALETVRRHAGEIRSFSGVLNATCNFILDQKGVTLDEAVKLAQRAGYAEADPRLDLDGTDAMQKLIILSRAAFGHAPQHVFQGGLQKIPGGRLVASSDGNRGEVRTVPLADDHPLASCAGAENRLLIELRSGERVVISAAGAGRWPTAEAVLADLEDLAGERARALRVA